MIPMSRQNHTNLKKPMARLMTSPSAKIQINSLLLASAAL
jgi:hypothetical protein